MNKRGQDEPNENDAQRGRHQNRPSAPVIRSTKKLAARRTRKAYQDYHRPGLSDQNSHDTDVFAGHSGWIDWEIHVMLAARGALKNGLSKRMVGWETVYVRLPRIALSHEGSPRVY